MKRVAKTNMRLATEEDSHLETYDNTKLVAGNTCPTWGVARYQMHRSMHNASRSLPLEMGSAMHEVFAWVRLITLALQQPDEDTANKVLHHHGDRLFTKDRLDLVCPNGLIMPDAVDVIHWTNECALNIIESSGYYDDERDKRRTISNMQEAALAYIRKWDWNHAVWMRDKDDPTSDVGIEIAFDIVMQVEYDDGSMLEPFRYTGKIDGIHWHKDKPNLLMLGENKTASRLNDAWATAFIMSSQITGYCMAASLFTEQQVTAARVHGLMVPLPKTYDYGGIVDEVVPRHNHHFESWCNWIADTVSMYRTYLNNPHDAPRYTHSCNRYFRACSMIPFCDSPKEDQIVMLEQMTVDEWSPLHKEIQE